MSTGKRTGDSRFPRFSAVCFAFLAGLFVLCASGTSAFAGQYAAYVMDAKTGRVLHSQNADARLHPASLTKMMTLYLVFEAVQSGRLNLEQSVTISPHAAGQPPSKIGFRPGQKVKLQDLIRAAAIKSANDAAVALAETVGGSEWKFAQLMTAKARTLGMTRSTFKNASGLTDNGHLSSAHDMAVLGQRLFYDFPQFYNIFSRNSVQVNGRTYLATNRRFVSGYRGADGIKTGYTRAAGFNLVGSAERGDTRLIAAVFGGRTGRTRDKEMMRLLDIGFDRAKGGGGAPAREPAIQRPASELLMVKSAPVPAIRPQSVYASAESLFAKGARNIGEALVPSAEAAVRPLENAPRFSPAPTPASRGNALISRAATQVPDLVVAGEPPDQGDGESGDSGAAWSIQVGAYSYESQAAARLAATQPADARLVNEADELITVARLGAQPLYRARYVGFTDERVARSACAELARHEIDCAVVPPGAW